MQYEADRKRLDDRSTSCLNLVEQTLARIGEYRSLNAFTFVDEEGARDAATAVDSRRASGDLRPFDGLILAVKDTMSVRGLPLACASRLLAGFTAEFDATVVGRLRDLGAIVIGKTNCDEFGMGSSSEYSAFGPVRNPIHPEWSAGGSSGGSAAAVAAGLCHAALGSDTGGSVRQPAAFCSVAGLRPTWSRISRYGLTAFASSMDTIGFLTPDAALAGRLAGAVEGADGRDAVCSVPDPREGSGREPRTIGIAGLEGPCADAVSDSAVHDALERIVDAARESGASIQHEALPGLSDGVGVYHALASVEAASNLSRFDGVRYGRRAPEAHAPGAAGFLDSITHARSQGFGAGGSCWAPGSRAGPIRRRVWTVPVACALASLPTWSHFSIGWICWSHRLPAPRRSGSAPSRSAPCRCTSRTSGPSRPRSPAARRFPCRCRFHPRTKAGRPACPPGPAPARPAGLPGSRLSAPGTRTGRSYASPPGCRPCSTETAGRSFTRDECACRSRECSERPPIFAACLHD